jgi:hypothetical protein
MPKGKRGTRTSYSAVTGDLRECARRNQHVLTRARGTKGQYCVRCVNCGRLFEAVRTEGFQWKPKCRVGDRCDEICPKAPFGDGDGI